MADLKTPREIAHEVNSRPGRIEDEDFTRAGMIEALRAVIRKVDGCDEPECAGQCAYEFANSKLAELEKS